MLRPPKSTRIAQCLRARRPAAPFGAIRPPAGVTDILRLRVALFVFFFILVPGPISISVLGVDVSGKHAAGWRG